MGIKQWFIKPTPKQFFYTSLIYAIVFPVIGILIANSIVSAFMLFFLALSALITRNYLKPSISSKGYNIVTILVPFIIVIGLIGLIGSCLTSSIFFTKIVEDKTSLEQVSGTIPDEPFDSRVGKRTSSSLLIRDTRLHCKHHDRDNCSKVYDYSGQTADILYQPGIWFGNVVYEISIDGKKLYKYEDQRADFKTKQRTDHRQWFLTFILFGIPSYWFYKHDKRLRKATPKISIEEEQALKKHQELASNEMGCAGAVGVFIFFPIVIFAGLAGIMHLAIQKFGLSMIYFGIAGMCWYVIGVLSTPSSEL